MKNLRRTSQVLVIALLTLSFSACTEDETMNELMETVDKYDLTDVGSDEKKKGEDDPMGG